MKEGFWWCSQCDEMFYDKPKIPDFPPDTSLTHRSIKSKGIRIDKKGCLQLDKRFKEHYWAQVPPPNSSMTHSQYKEFMKDSKA
jgi:hypothetical protein